MQGCEKELIAIISSSVHDMKTPLTSISGFAEAIIEDKIPKDKQAHYLQIIKDEAERLSRICDGLLSASRIEAGEEKYEMKSFDIAECVRRVLISLEDGIERKKLDVSFESEEGTVPALGDEASIYRVLYNVCENAVKFSCEGGKLFASVKYDEEKVSVRIENEGEGIDKDGFSDIFTPFFRKGEKKGSGLGMYIAKRIMDSHGGSIFAESEEGRSTAFTVILNRG